MSDDLVSRSAEVDSAFGRREALGRAAEILAAGLGSVGADAGFAAIPTPGWATLLVARVTPFAAAPVWLTIPANSPYPLAVAARSNEEIFISSNEDLVCEHPGLLRVRADDHACATAPLHDGSGSVVGSANVSFEEPREFTDADRAALRGLFAACESALGA